MAIASAKISRLQSRASVIGWKNNPIAERGPKEMSAIRQPQTMMSGMFGPCLTCAVGAFIGNLVLELPTR